MNISDSVILITGSSKRVGKTIALTLASKGAKICVHYHTSPDEAIKTADEIKHLGADAIIVQADLKKKSDWLQMKETIVEKWHRLDILVNNAAIFYPTPFLDATEKQWDDFMDTNLKSVFLGCQVFGELMMKQQTGKIINITDVSAETVWAKYIPYCISKAGVSAITKGLAKAFAPHVTVNAVAPGTVLLAEEYDESEENALIEKTPLKRVGSPHDIANTVAFLIEGSDFITGEIVKVDGGRSIA